MGTIGVVEMHSVPDMHMMQEVLIGEGVWLRPFGKLLYTMPPYIVTREELGMITRAIGRVLHDLARDG